MLDSVVFSGYRRVRAALGDPSHEVEAIENNVSGGVEVPAPGPLTCRALPQTVDFEYAIPLRDARGESPRRT